MNTQKKIKHTEHRMKRTGELVDDSILNKWGYPTGLVFAGCITTKNLDDNIVLYTNVWTKPTNKRKSVTTPKVNTRTVKELKEECKAMGLKIGGKKADLIERLDAHYATLRGEEE
tara:strand:- start:11320 stop:11664 length:345 start_codon:yes stop_codon:yes gene_type:complete